jgi:hypothetical protein
VTENLESILTGKFKHLFRCSDDSTTKDASSHDHASQSLLIDVHAVRMNGTWPGAGGLGQLGGLCTAVHVQDVSEHGIPKRREAHDAPLA